MADHIERLVELLVDIRKELSDRFYAEPDDFFVSIAQDRAKIAPLEAAHKQLARSAPLSGADRARLKDIGAEIAIRSLKPKGLVEDATVIDAAINAAVDRFVAELTPDEKASLYGSGRSAQNVMRNTMKLVQKPSQFASLGLSNLLDDMGDGLALTNIAKAFEESTTPYTDAVNTAMGIFPTQLEL